MKSAAAITRWHSFYQIIDYTGLYYFQNLYHNLIFSIGIKPFVKRKGKQYTGVIKRWADMQMIKGENI